MISKAKQRKIGAYMNMLDTMKRKEEEQKRISVYMDLCNVIVKNDGDRWIIDSPDSGPDGFDTRAELMAYINGELEEIRKVYESNGEMDELRAIYEENGMEV